MRVNEVCEIITTKLDKLHSNFSWHLLDQYTAIKEGDKVSFLMTLVTTIDDPYFYQMGVLAKLQKVNHMKTIAGQFFKIANFKKAAKIYSKINSYFQFGDAKNNYRGENGPEYDEKDKELQGLKIVSFVNLVVCKYKLKEFQSIIGITDQILEMDPSNVKGYYFRGKALLEL